MTQLWTDELIQERYETAFEKRPDVHHMALLTWMRDDYERERADLAALRQRVQELDEIRDAIGLCAAAVVLAYYRKTHDHILVDNDAIDAALKVEHWLGRR